MNDNKFWFELVKKDESTFARRGVIHTPNGDIETPAFSPVGTKASVKAMSPNDLKQSGTQVVLANTYHLLLRPGMEVIRDFEGFSNFMEW